MGQLVAQQYELVYKLLLFEMGETSNSPEVSRMCFHSNYIIHVKKTEKIVCGNSYHEFWGPVLHIGLQVDWKISFGTSTILR